MSHNAAAKTLELGLRRVSVFAIPPAPPQAFDRLVREVAEQCLEPTLRRLRRSQTMRMGVAELRGYTRARAALPVEALSRSCAQQGRLTESSVDELASRALERVVHAVVNQLTQPATVSATLLLSTLRPLRLAG